MECPWDTALLERGEELSTELLYMIQHGSNEQYLATFTTTLLDARYTFTLLAHCEDLLPHICACLRKYGSVAATTAALGRVVPFAPYLMPYAMQLLENEHYSLQTSVDDSEDLLYLLGLFRLLRYNPRVLRRHVRSDELAMQLGKQSRPVTYLILRILQLCLDASDDWFEEAIKRFLGADATDNDIAGTWDQKVIDYRFLSFWEEDMHDTVSRMLSSTKRPSPTASASQRILPPGLFHPSTALVAGIILPRLSPHTGNKPSEKLIQTSTTAKNLALFARSLRSSRPILLSGLAGSGKSLLVRYLARSLGKLDSLVTLHLNEQSDAKLLLGMYTTGTTPGSFVWKPGVLTTAVQEGRWVLIEDLDRAPNEILGTLLPLVEKRQLLIANRKETIYAAEGFRILATIRTSINHRGSETKPSLNLLGFRHWQQIPISMPSTAELATIAWELFPCLKPLLPRLMAVFERLLAARQQSVSATQSKTGVMRSISPRDQLKWCSRIESLLKEKTTFTSYDIDAIFLECIDCFIGSLPDDAIRTSLAAIIAEELQVDPHRRDYLLTTRDVLYESAKSKVTIGRYVIPKARQLLPRQSHFSTNPHTARMLERVTAAILNKEPLLLVGETGVGKTTAVQHLATVLGRKLVAFNLSQQSEAGDLLGGFKPVSARTLMVAMKDEFDKLFLDSFSSTKNKTFLDLLGKQMAKSNWKAVCKLWHQALGMVAQQRSASPSREGEAPSKRRKVVGQQTIDFSRWEAFAVMVRDMERQLANSTDTFAFTFVEGNIVKAVRNGDWVLLDEINLASPDTLESVADLLDSSEPSLLLTEAGNIERVTAHPDFRIFAAMNPATDVGKKDLPPGIRSLFTELYVESPDNDMKSLQSIVRSYLREEAGSDAALASDLSLLYQQIISLATDNKLVDGSGQKPHFSLRTLTRTLSYSKHIQQTCHIRRALYEGFQMSFLTFLDTESAQIVQPLIMQHLFGRQTNISSELKKPLRKPDDERSYVQGHPGSKHWLRQGPLDLQDQPQYIITPFIANNLENLVRATSTRQFPVLIQGPTSSGKTSMIEYLAKRTGHHFTRINNHEHTDVNEYLGTYISTSDGRLQFQEGVLVKALREGHWLVLDELNLAPTDVLEALNRLLDDNRELLIPETQETVRPHPNFMLFATQNPAGLYGGRKALSRAFRNRFLELHFDDIPVNELQDILHRRTSLPESRCRRIVRVYRELSILRQESRLFEQKSFATLRDLFRWAQRQNDTIDELAANGFMLLCERVRKHEERVILKAVIEKVMSEKGPRVHINEDALYGSDCAEVSFYKQHASRQDVVWTRAMRRLYVLVSRAIANHEPVLLIGETGCGKTTVCQMFAAALQKQLRTVNAHQSTETGDLIGSQRPVRNRGALELSLRQLILGSTLMQPLSLADGQPTQVLLDAYDAAVNKLEKIKKASYLRSPLHCDITSARTRFKALFEWMDGSLVNAMREGALFLLDEISLADDSVLERINSVLESERTILLAEKGSLNSFVRAAEGFEFLATMNPGGDYGKRELSPALRNRFTEIWVPGLSDMDDILDIVRANLVDVAQPLAEPMVAFSSWFKARFDTSASSSISVRDTLAWVQFVNMFASLDREAAIVHGAAMVYIDTLGANPAGLMSLTSLSLEDEREICLGELGRLSSIDAVAIYKQGLSVTNDGARFGIGPFFIKRQTSSWIEPNIHFSFEPPTTRTNAMRVLRALQLTKPVMLEGSPGVGKTALVTAIAKAAGMPLTRINLSDQTDLLDLFGSDVPVEGAQTGTFVWRDAPFLRAMKRGEWVLLDEMNLASQSVLEGLNACLDHRGEIFVPELGQVFLRHPHFRLFAAQNPHHQGGGRKGLPASFVNRFTVVYADSFRSEDLLLICKATHPQINRDYLKQTVAFIARLNEQINNNRQFAANGGPWEFNLRDIIRWLTLVSSNDGLLKAGSSRDFVDMLFKQRFRSTPDRSYLHQMYNSIFDPSTPLTDMHCGLSTRTLQVGMAMLPRSSFSIATGGTMGAPARPVIHLRALQAVMLCVSKAWPVILAGPPACGKTYLIEQLAECVGAEIVTIPMSADTDALDLIGGYEQFDPHRQRTSAMSQLIRRLRDLSKIDLIESVDERIADLLRSLRDAEIGSLDAHALSKLVALMPHHVQHELQALLQAIIHTSQTIDKAKFEWIDGPLVEALQLGKWLVLDNANLCSASVLDRLNSLLEPDGSLIINEHSTEEGLPRVIRPHEAFRIFLTVDPRSGELSRAMRNRAVELYLLPEENVSVTHKLYSEAALARMRIIKNLEATNKHTLSIASDHLGYCDMQLLPRLQRQLDKGLFSIHKTLPGLAPVTFPMENLGFKIEEFYQEISGSVQVPADFACVQTIHPLNNSSLAQQSQYSLLKSLSLATQFDLTIASNSLANELASIGQDRKISEKLSRFWKSFRQEAKTITKSRNGGILQHIREFVNITVNATGQIACSSKADLADSRITLNRVHSLCWIFARILRSEDLNLATLSALISLGQKMVAPHALLQNSSLFLSFHQLSRALDELALKCTKGTGKGLLALWQALRPEVPASMDKLNALIKFEGVIDQFDNVSLAVQLPLPQIVDLRQAFLQALRLSTSADTKLDSLVQQAIAVVPREAQNLLTVIPHFTKTFELLCQHFACVLLDGMKMPPLETIKLEALAQRRTTESASLCTELDCRTPRQKLSLLSLTMPRSHQENEKSVTINESIILGKFAVDKVSLRNLSLLEIEVQVLGSTVGSYAHLLDKDVVSSLKAALKDLMLTVLQSLAVDEKNTKIAKYASQLLGALNKESLTHDSDLILSGQVAIDDNTLLPLLPLRNVIDYLQSPSSDSQQASTAWANFATTCLHLYIPERDYDPVQELALNKTIYQHTKDDMHARLNALLSLQEGGDIESESLRARLLREDIETHGPVPIVQEICRPPQTQIPQLQNEFQALLRTVQPLRQNDQNGYTGSTIVDANSWNNILVIQQRLQDQYRPYSDLTSPVIGFIDCLSISRQLRLRAARQQATSSLLRTSITPLAGATLQDWMSEQCLLREHQKLHTHDEQLYWLSLLAARESICSTTLRSPQLCAAIESIFFSFYQTWRAELSREQKAAAAKSSLYQYRGGDDNSEEATQQQLDELFPTYDDSTTFPTSPRGENNVQALAPTMVALYHAIYNPTGETTHNLISLLKQRSQSASSLAASTELPATLVHLDKLNTAMLQTPSAQTINIYVDTDIRQSRSLASLVTKVRCQFEFINNAWPEHATPIEVLRSCDQLLAFGHSEPIARYLPPLDKLHANVNEWQKITSSEFSANTLLDEIVNLIVSWRQLELSTWAGMFDTEDQLCRQQAASWWYIAYESIICGFEDARQGHIATSEFRQSLVTTLTDFMTHCGIGEYSTRLAMIQDFGAALATQGERQGDQTRMALASLISFYSRFDSTVNGQLSANRKELEKEIQNVIQLASWKDRNIETLRQSAKASHRKLFRIVRKYRQLLSRSVASIICGSFPYVNINTENFTSGQPSIISPNTQHLDQESRAKIAALRESTTAISKINSFLHNLENESSELRKATPSTRTEENKSIVQHLKTRKRRLFADVLRDLRIMGFRTNVSEEVMLQQRSLPLTLSRTSPLSLHGDSRWAEAADQELHRLLHIMPSARESAIKHSDDLTPAEVTRSKIFLESMLHETLAHRCIAAQHLTNLTRLKSALGQLAGLCSSENIQMQTSSWQYFEFQVKSLRAMLGASAHCVEAQGRLCGRDYSYELTTMRSTIEEFGKICNDLLQQAILPQHIKNENTATLRDRFYEGLKNIELILDVSFSKHPELEPTLRPLLGWIRDAAVSGHSPSQNKPSVMSPQEWIRRLSQLSDTVPPQPLKASTTSVSGQTNKAWLLHEQETLLSALQGMQLEAIGQDLTNLLSELHQVNFDAAESSAQIISSCRKVQSFLSIHVTIAEDMINTIILLHATASKMANVLATFFLQLTKQGFCQPPERAEDDNQKSGQVESGTGLGEGEGGEDISKDIGNDEDLSELAQEAKSKEHEEGAEAEKDAVDMADEEFEGQFDKDDVSPDEGQEDGQKDDEDSDIEEEAGHVDDKDPGTVDEKTLEAQSAGEAEKEAQNEKGVKNEDISAAAEGSEQQDLEQSEDDADGMDVTEGDESNLAPNQPEQADPHLEEEGNLDLPEDLNMDADKDEFSDVSDAGSDPADDMDDSTIDQQDGAADNVDVEMSNQQGEAKQEDTDEAATAERADESDADRKDQISDVAMLEDQDQKVQPEDGFTAAEEGRGSENENSADTIGAPSGAEQLDNEDDAEQPNAQPGNAEGANRSQDNTTDSKAETGDESHQRLPYKQLGDILKQWYNNHRDIESAQESEASKPEVENLTSMEDTQFEHTDEAEADMQAVGATSAEQSTALNEHNAVDLEQDEPDPTQNLDNSKMDMPNEEDEKSSTDVEAEHGIDPATHSKKTVVGNPVDAYADADELVDQMSDLSSDEISDVDDQLTRTHISTYLPTTVSIEGAQRAWAEYESRTRNMAVVLTEHLRLILQPTQATKMRGDFRTGKRLNIKKIIPYIASSYKRDKIWMRRSMPSKRSYQIMLAIDDSESMNEGERKNLAFETLALVAKSLSMLEVGELCIVGFGETTRVNHDFATPFTTDAGPAVVRQFGFSQIKTDVRKLLERSIQLFREARLRASGSASDLWQLQLIISDGLCEDHPSIRRLVRQAHEEQIMMVFIVVDATAVSPQRQQSTTASGKQSILDLQRAEFSSDANGDPQITMVKYLDTFPFRYYLIVRDVMELPGVLAGALRQWFVEVAET